MVVGDCHAIFRDDEPAGDVAVPLVAAVTLVDVAEAQHAVTALLVDAGGSSGSV